MKELTAKFERARLIADAVLWEGYVLYPYRASAAKNRIRFQWGVVGPAEERTMTTTIVADPSAARRVAVRLRFLHPQAREDGWDEAVEVVQDTLVAFDDVERSPDGALSVPIAVDAANFVGDDGQRRRRAAVHGRLRLAIARHGRYLLLRADVENDTADGDEGDDRHERVRRSFVGTHLMFAADGDAFVSLIDPPPDAEAAVAECVNHRTWPVLVGPAPARDLFLSSPIILYDYPNVAPESVGDFYDGTEIDEMLALRVQTLTDGEKAEARALDSRAAAIIDRCDELSPAAFSGLHGTIRELTVDDSFDGAVRDLRDHMPTDPLEHWSEPGPARVIVAGVSLVPGSKVVLRPSRRADVHDMFLAGRTATIAEIVHDVDDEIHVAVTIDDDPAAEMMLAHGRYRYFAPDELVPVNASIEDGRDV